MKRIFFIVTFILFLTVSPGNAGFLDSVLENVRVSTTAPLDDETLAKGLKEALSTGTGNAVGALSAFDGYFGNQAVKILMPKRIKKIGNVLSKFGYRKQVDEFILSMNRAAEKAASRARPIFVDAIKTMTFEDARKILKGGDTAATDYFRNRTSKRLYESFKPAVSSSMNEVGVTRHYKDLMQKYAAIPFMKKESMDLDHYVTDKALAGLFYMVGEEEKKIRTDPRARVTDLLKKVFGE